MANNSNGQFVFEYDTISPKLEGSNRRAEEYLAQVTRYEALRVEDFAKTHATWHDRTGNARSGLTGLADVSGQSQGHFEVTLFGSVPYQIWLEVRFDQRYAIIRPTITEEAPIYFATASDVIRRMFPGA